MTNGTSYTFTVHATNANGDSPESAASSAVTPATPPGAPTGVSATAGDSQASVSFTAPASNGGSAITSYTVTSSPGGKTATCPGSPCTVTGLTNGTSYTFTVHATNAIDDSVESAASAAVMPVSVPGAPTGVSAQPGDGQASVSFTAPADHGGLTITSYTVTASPGGATATCPGSPCVVTGLSDGTSYTFTVHATNSEGDSAESAASAAVTPAALPGAPTGVSATPGNGQASVSFTAPASDGGATITGYTVTASPGGATATCSSSPCVVTGLTGGTSYTFTVHATNDIGDSPESAASAAVTPVGPPAKPASVQLTPGDGQIGISFPVPASNGSAITGYEVTTDGGLSWTTLNSTVANGTVTGTVTGLSNGTAYSVQVRAVNVNGEGAASTSQSVTPATMPDAPTGVSATGGAGSASVSFTAPADNGGSTVTSYTVTASPGGATATCNGSPCEITGLTNGTSYTFTVHATNALGSSAESAASAAVTPMAVPGAPASLTTKAHDTSIELTFPAPDSGGSPITGYEYSIDGGMTWLPLTTAASGSDLTGTITGLTPGTEYPVTLRGVNAVGAGTAVAVTDVTTVPAALAAPTAEAGRASALVSWTKSTTGTVTGYTVYAEPGPATCTTTSADDTSCVIGATDGVSYTYTVVANSPAGPSVASPASAELVASAPVIPGSAPTTAPTTLTTTEGVLTEVRPGQQITVLGTGFLPYSSVSIIVYSSPVLLGAAVTDSHGAFTKKVTVPTDLEAGSHNLVASGVDQAGATRLIRMPVTLSPATSGGNGSNGSGSSGSGSSGTGSDGSAGGSLPNTGVQLAHLAVWTGLITAAGLWLIAAGRRRRYPVSE
ncbi:MAG: fibronectin type III domain-containing protein [Actinobacteria bacterium]|nr:fibronectin type III domain-containing protein [Actinomycetota bacterium]